MHESRPRSDLRVLLRRYRSDTRFHALPVPPLAACSSGPHGTYAHLVWKNMRIAMALHTAHTKGVVAGHDGGGDARPGRIPCCAGRKA